MGSPSLFHRECKRARTQSLSPREAGFILPLVLVALAMMSLALWSAVSVFELATRNTQDLRDDVRLEIAVTNIEARLGYLMTTQPIGPAGLRLGGYRISSAQAIGMAPLTEEQLSAGLPDYLYLDGRTYMPPLLSKNDPTLPDKLTVQLQDRAGLVNLNSQDEAMLQRMLSDLQVDAKAARRLSGALLDYTDRDDFKRLEGAEREAYERESLPPPRNEPLRNQRDAFNALGWSDLDADVRDEILNNTYVGPAGAPKNVNTASVLSLKSWFDLSPTQIERIMKSRLTLPFRSLDEFAIRSGLPIVESELNSYTLPSATVRLKVQRSGPRCRLFEVWLSQSNGTSSRPLFFGTRTDMSCPASKGARNSTETKPNAEVVPFPDLPNLFPAGSRRD